jgi:hypothetical protein
MPPETPNPNATEHERKEKNKFNFFSENWGITTCMRCTRLCPLNPGVTEIPLELHLLSFLPFLLPLTKLPWKDSIPSGKRGLQWGRRGVAAMGKERGGCNVVEGAAARKEGRGGADRV